MARIAINYDPRMTRYLVEHSRVFEDHPITIVDVGARWGFNAEWAPFGDRLRVFCFEPDEAECRRLNESAPEGIRYLPYALGRARGEATFYENRVGASSGIYRTNMDYFSRLLNRDNGVVIRERTASLTTLTEALAEFGVEEVDFIKLDVEGAEVDVLAGGEKFLRDGRLIGLLSEIRFQQEINGSPTFSALDQFLVPHGLRLFDLQFHHQSRYVLPYPGLSDYRTERGERLFAYTEHGQVMDGDALYFRDLLIPANAQHRAHASADQLLKTAAFFEIYSMNDCAAELIDAHRNLLDPIVSCDGLLDLLTPEVYGERLSYAEYKRRYFDPEGGVFVQAPADSKAELERLYASRCWRLTRPIRRLASRLRRLGNRRTA